MERTEFLRGWVFLTTQPWGRPYRDGQPEAHLQLEYYWRHVKNLNPIVWEAVCDAMAQGDHWPSLGELKQSIHVNAPSSPQILLDRNATIEWANAPWPLQVVFNYQAQHHTTLKDAALAVLPQWLQDNPNHEDYADARLFYEKAQKNFGVPLRRGGNIRCSP